MNTKDKIKQKCKQIETLLLEKNKAYGDSALNPAGIFSKLKASEAIKFRLDDKLKRIQNVGVNDETEDTLMDCAGYMILLMIAKDNESNTVIIRFGLWRFYTSISFTYTNNQKAFHTHGIS